MSLQALSDYLTIDLFLSKSKHITTEDGVLYPQSTQMVSLLKLFRPQSTNLQTAFGQLKPKPMSFGVLYWHKRKSVDRHQSFHTSYSGIKALALGKHWQEYSHYSPQLSTSKQHRLVRVSLINSRWERRISMAGDLTAYQSIFLPQLSQTRQPQQTLLKCCFRHLYSGLCQISTDPLLHNTLSRSEQVQVPTFRQSLALE